MKETMKAAFLPGNSTVEMRTVPVPKPSHGEVLIAVKASTICGSDIRAIYHEHLGKGPEGYQGVIAGHEPCGQIVEVGPGCRRFKVGDRAIVYHISGCGVCNDCRRGYMISCTSTEYRRAYGWQRDGGMAEFLLAEEKDLIHLPDSLTYLDGAQVACGFGTVYEALQKIGIDGNHAVLITGLGPVGLAAGALSRKLGAEKIVGIDISDERRDIALRLGLCDVVLAAGPDNVNEVRKLTGGYGVERAVDCSGHADARAVAIRATRKWGKIVMVGEGGTVAFNPSPDIIHDQKTIFGSWVTSTWLMEELVERLVRWNLHPEDIVTHRFTLDEASEAYKLMASGRCGKVAVCPAAEWPMYTTPAKPTSAISKSKMNVGPDRNPETWEQQLKKSLPLLGHRNWIVVADSAYPAQTSEGIKTIATSADYLEVLAKTLCAIAECRHVRAKLYFDAEFRHVTEEDAPGVSALRRELDRLLKNEKTSELGHEQVIAKLDESSRLYQILIFKTTLAIPYASVFIQLDCGYWSDEAEKRLRHSLQMK